MLNVVEVVVADWQWCMKLVLSSADCGAERTRTVSAFVNGTQILSRSLLENLLVTDSNFLEIARFSYNLQATNELEL